MEFWFYAAPQAAIEAFLHPLGETGGTWLMKESIPALRISFAIQNVCNRAGAGRHVPNGPSRAPAHLQMRTPTPLIPPLNATMAAKFM
jgi:hypothetical protein